MTFAAFVGQARGEDMIARLSAAGIGECTTPFDCWPPRRRPWFLDNGAFGVWAAAQERAEAEGRTLPAPSDPFDGSAWRRALTRAAGEIADLWPVFGVTPDVVAAGYDSLAFSLWWLPQCRAALGVPWYLAVQDGMTLEDVRAALEADTASAQISAFDDGIGPGGRRSAPPRMGRKPPGDSGQGSLF